MDEPRTKLVCNLGKDDFFVYPGLDGTWRNTGVRIRVRDADSGKSWMAYECRQIEDNDRYVCLKGGERVYLR